MKRFFCLACLIALSEISLCAQGYFLDNTGATLEYVRKDASDGSFRWRHKINVTDIRETDTHCYYTTRSVFTKQNGKPLYRGDVLEKSIVEKSTGNLSLDVGQAMTSYIKARTGINATAKGVLSSLPAQIQPGDTLVPVFAQAKVGPIIYQVSVTDRKVLRRENISVPAGTFDCIVVQEHKVESGPGHHRDVVNVSWYSKGVGYVRHDTYIKGKLDTSEILQSIH
jgi:hypothetical protein